MIGKETGKVTKDRESRRFQGLKVVKNLEELLSERLKGLREICDMKSPEINKENCLNVAKVEKVPRGGQEVITKVREEEKSLEIGVEATLDEVGKVKVLKEEELEDLGQI